MVYAIQLKVQRVRKEQPAKSRVLGETFGLWQVLQFTDPRERLRYRVSSAQRDWPAKSTLTTVFDGKNSVKTVIVFEGSQLGEFDRVPDI